MSDRRITKYFAEFEPPEGTRAEEPGEPQPDLAVIERGAGPDGGRLMPAEAVTLLVEVVATNSVHRDYEVKRSIYAAAKLPGYLIIDAGASPSSATSRRWSPSVSN